jgi:transcriptional regulator with XRE-family HTH domain
VNPVVLARAGKGWTQSELASRAGVGVSTVKRAESGVVPSRIVAAKLSLALGVGVDVLFPNREEKAA